MYSETYPHSSPTANVVDITAKRVISDEEINIRNEAKAFWEELDNPTQTETPSPALVRAWSEEYIIPEFNNDALLRTRWSGACGPAALAWLYRAYNTHYNGVFYPLHGGFSNALNFGLDPNNRGVSVYAGRRNPLYIDLAERCRVGYGMDPFKDATFPSDLVKAANETFPNHFLVDYPNIRSIPRNQIENDNNPVVLLIRSGVELHYVVGFGTKNRYNTYNLWLFKVRKVHTDSWIRVSDNGTTMKDHGDLPYYMNTHAILGKSFGVFVLHRR